MRMDLYPDAAPPDDARMARMRQDTLTRIAMRGGSRPRRTHAVRLRASMTAALSLVAVAALGVIVGLPGGSAGRQAGTQPGNAPDQTRPGSAAADPLLVSMDAGETLRLVAERGEQATPLRVGKDQYIYIHNRLDLLGRIPLDKKRAQELGRQRKEYDGEYAWVRSGTAQDWWIAGRDYVPQRFSVTAPLDPRPLTRRDEAKLKAIGYIWPKPSTHTEGRSEPGLAQYTSPAYLATLPTNPQQLMTRIAPSGQRGGPPGSPADNLYRLTRLGRASADADAILGADLRTAFYRAIASVPGVVRVPGQVDIDGRKGVAIGVVADGLRVEIIFDPRSGRVLGTRRVLVDCSPQQDRSLLRDYCDGTNPVAVGTVIEQTTTLQRVVDNVGATS